MKSALLIAVASLVLAGGLAAQSVPAGFQNEVAVSGFNNSVGLGFAPDGRLFVCEKNSGRIYVCDVNSGQKQLVGTVPSVRTGSERGLLGVCVDPSWPANPYIFINYSHTAGNMRIARYTITGSVGTPSSLALSLGSQYQVVNTIPDSAFNHNGGTVRFGPDGALYASFGDDANSCTAQSISDGRGVILRMDVSGLPSGAGGPPSINSLAPSAGNGFIPNTNWVGNTGFGPITYAYGLRNPFRFSPDAVNGRLYIADVGLGSREEMDEVLAPGESGSRNMGWPRFEGFLQNGPNCLITTNGQAVAPIADETASSGWHSIMTFGRYRQQPGGSFNFGSSFDGNVFYHDYYGGVLRRLEWNGSSWVKTTFGTGYSSVSDGVTGPDGAIYYTVNSGSGVVRRIKSTANAAQVNIISGNGQAGNAGLAASQNLRVQVTTPSGTPMVGTTVNWTLAAGFGTVVNPVVQTDAGGFAETGFIFDPAQAGNPTVRASVVGGLPANFSLTWRGLSASYFASGVALVTFRGAVNQPYILAVDVPVASPYVALPWGDMWTSLIDPVASPLIILDGTGLFAPADPTIVTGATNNVDTILLTGIVAPPSPVSFLLQAYGLDPAFAGTFEEIIITNAVTLTIQ